MRNIVFTYYILYLSILFLYEMIFALCAEIDIVYNIFNELYNISVTKVTSHKMNESEMGNRVAKSNMYYLENNFSLSLDDLFVKVQRVYGSTCI